VSTDEKEIAGVAKRCGAKIIQRPKEISGDFSPSEDALKHAINEIQKENPRKINYVVFLHVPVQKMPLKTPIYKIKVSYKQGNFLERHWKSIELAYKKAPYFEEYKPLFEKIYSKKHILLRDLNVEIIKTICDILGIKKKIVFSSELNLKDENMTKTEKVVNLCKKLGITDFYEPEGGKTFVDESLFKKEGILIRFQDYKHPEYPQLWGDFVPYLSVIDLLFNEGERSLSIIRGGRNK